MLKEILLQPILTFLKIRELEVENFLNIIKSSKKEPNITFQDKIFQAAPIKSEAKQKSLL